MIIVRKRPNEVPEFAYIDSTTEALRTEVEGHFEIIGSREHTGNFVINTYYNRDWDEDEQEGEYNCTIEGRKIYGPVIYIGPLAGGFEDAPREVINLLLLQRHHKTLGKKRWLW